MFWPFFKKLFPIKFSFCDFKFSLGVLRVPLCKKIIFRYSQYASNGMRSITVAANLRQLEAVKVGPPGSNLTIWPVYVPFGLLCSKIQI